MGCYSIAASEVSLWFVMIMVAMIIIIVVMIMSIIMVIIIIIIIIMIIMNTRVSRALPPAQLGGQPASVIYINGNGPRTISITDALSPYSHRPASGGAFVFSFGLLPVAVWLTSGLFSAAAWAPASWHSAGMDALAALDEALRAVFFVRRVRVVWESNFGTRFMLGAAGARRGKWKELARIDWMRGTVKDDEQNIWW